MLAASAFRRLPSSYATQQGYVFGIGCMTKKLQCTCQWNAQRQWKRHWTLYDGLIMLTRLYKYYQGSADKTDASSVYAITRQDPEVAPENWWKGISQETQPALENSSLGFLKLFISGNERCHTTDAPLAHNRNSIFKCKQQTLYNYWGPE